ncbi:MAG TPA: hypothetical protein VHZ03_26250 [Trebonia sp.]|nr:hypothetical protein [Trebonia sp.]
MPSTWNTRPGRVAGQPGLSSQPGFLGQLDAPGHVVDVRPLHIRPPRAGSPQVAPPHAGVPQAGQADIRPAPVRAPRRPDGPDATPCVLLLSRTCDTGLTRVQALLEGVGIRVSRVDADALPAAVPNSLAQAGPEACAEDGTAPGRPAMDRAGLDRTSLVLDLNAGRVRLDGHWLAPTVIWLRHFTGRAIEVGQAGTVASALFARDSWQEVAEQVAAISPRALGARRLGTIEQLALARRLGVAVPRTIVTTDLSAARAAFSCARLVVKAAREHFVEAEPGRLTGIFPQVIERRDLPVWPGQGPPVIVQEHVEHTAELRVYYAAGRVLGFEVGKRSPADPWTSPADVTVTTVAVSPAVDAATRALASAMSLEFGAFDFLIRAGEPVFLEANPDGDWDWAERMAGGEVVTHAVAAMLARLHRSVTLPASRAPFNLVAFLTACTANQPDRSHSRRLPESSR